MKISVITVCFNSAATIGDTLRSVAGQTYPNVEHIVVDGGSHDETLNIIREYAHPGMKWQSEPDRGVYDAMNKGIGMASGDVVGFLNADDFYDNPDVLADIAKAFANPDVDATYADLVYVSQADAFRVVRYWKSGEYAKGAFSRGWMPPHPTFYARQEVYQRLGGFDLDYHMAADVECLMRLIEVGGIRLHYIPKVMVCMRMGGLTNRSWTNVAKQNLEIIRAARKNQIPFSILRFFVLKFFSRAAQFIRRLGYERH